MEKEFFGGIERLVTESPAHAYLSGWFVIQREEKIIYKMQRDGS